ncbi:nucleotidyltransferase family protein [Halanaerocella petrolearia]
MLDAIILAGAKNTGKFSSVSNQQYEALIEVGGQPMVKYIIETLQQVALMDKIIGVGPSELKQQGIDILVPDQDSLLENIKFGLQTANSPYVLLITSDIPLLTTEAIDSFLAQCKNVNNAFYYPIIPKVDLEEMFPQAKKTYFKLEEGTFTGGNLFLLNRKILLELEEELIKVLEFRKKPWRLVRLLGLKFIFKFWTGTLCLTEVEERINELFGYSGQGIILSYPEVGFDIDEVHQLDLIEEVYYNSLQFTN